MWMIYRAGRGGEGLDSAKEWPKKILEAIRARRFGLNALRPVTVSRQILKGISRIEKHVVRYVRV